MKSANHLHKGDKFYHEGKIYKVIEQPLIVKPGKGGAFAQVVAHNIFNGSKIKIRFRSDETIEQPDIRNETRIFLYSDGEVAYFDDGIEYALNDIEFSAYLTEGMEVTLERCDGDIVDIHLPIELQDIIQSNNGNYIVLQSGIKIKGKDFLKAGEVIIFNRETLNFVRRLNSYNNTN